MGRVVLINPREDTASLGGQYAEPFVLRLHDGTSLTVQDVMTQIREFEKQVGKSIVLVNEMDNVEDVEQVLQRTESDLLGLRWCVAHATVGQDTSKNKTKTKVQEKSVSEKTEEDERVRSPGVAKGSTTGQRATFLDADTAKQLAKRACLKYWSRVSIVEGDVEGLQKYMAEKSGIRVLSATEKMVYGICRRKVELECEFIAQHAPVSKDHLMEWLTKNHRTNYNSSTLPAKQREHAAAWYNTCGRKLYTILSRFDRPSAVTDDELRPQIEYIMPSWYIPDSYEEIDKLKQSQKTGDDRMHELMEYVSTIHANDDVLHGSVNLTWEDQIKNMHFSLQQKEKEVTKLQSRLRKAQAQNEKLKLVCEDLKKKVASLGGDVSCAANVDGFHSDGEKGNKVDTTAEKGGDVDVGINNAAASDVAVKSSGLSSSGQDAINRKRRKSN